MIGGLLDIVNKFVPDTTKAQELEAKIQNAHTESLNKAVEADTKIRLAEMHSKGIVSKWRPLAAISIFLCLFLRWFVYPALLMLRGIFNCDWWLPLEYDLPLEFYGLATAFISIYAYGRSKDKRL